MRMFFIAIALVAPVSVSAQQYEWLQAPVKMKHFKENAEGMITEGYEVTDKRNKFTVACKVKNGTPGIIEWNGARRIEEVNKSPKVYLSDPGGYSELKMIWAEVCKKIVN